MPLLNVFLVDSRTADPLNSCEYAFSGCCEEASAYFACGVDDSEFQLSSFTEMFPRGAAEGMNDVCDMCGHLLPPLIDEHLRQQHIQVLYACSNVSTLITGSTVKSHHLGTVCCIC